MQLTSYRISNAGRRRIPKAGRRRVYFSSGNSLAVLQRAADLLAENGCRADEQKVVAPPSDSESGPLMILAADDLAPLASR